MGNYLFPSNLSSVDGCSSLMSLQGGDANITGKVEHSLKEDDATLNVATVVALLSDPKKLYEQYFVLPESVEKLKVKLVLVDLEQQKGVATWLLANISHANGWTRYGFNHTGIQVGPYILHFFNDGLVHFTTLKSRKPLMAISLGELYFNNADHVSMLHKLCDLIATFNTKRKYDSLHCNCHTFCEQVITILGFNASIESFGGQIGEYLHKIKTNVMSKEFKCPFTQKVYDFKTHGELDTYVNQVVLKEHQHLVKNLREFEVKYKNDYILLKAFDRGFWMGKFYEEAFKEPDQAHVEQCKPCECPFLDPYINSVI